MAYIIYIAKNRITGDEYVGVTKQRLEDRRWKHFSDANRDGGCRIFCRAIQKYGREAFDWSVHIGDLDYDDAMQAEIDTIAARRPAYNITAGGRGFRGVKKSPEHIAKIAEKLKGKKRTPESIARMVQTRSDPVYRERQAAALRGKRRSPETVAKMLANKRPDAHFKSVLCLEDGMLHSSVKGAAIYYGVGRTTLSSVLSGQRISLRGLHFILSPHQLSDEERARLVSDKESAREKKKLGRKGRPVRALPSNERFINAKTAAIALGVSQQSVSALCRRGGVTRGGLSFRFDSIS